MPQTQGVCFGDMVAKVMFHQLGSILVYQSGVQLFCMGIMGQYLAKTFMEVKKRPIFILKETNCEEPEQKD